MIAAVRLGAREEGFLKTTDFWLEGFVLFFGLRERPVADTRNGGFFFTGKRVLLISPTFSDFHSPVEDSNETVKLSWGHTSLRFP